MTLVFARSETTNGSRLAMLAIADNADDEGVAYPSIAKIAAKSRLSVRGAQTAIRAAEEMGELKIETAAGPYGCNQYRINLALLRSRKTPSAPPAESAPHADVTPPQNSTKTPADSAGKPSVEPSTTAEAEARAQRADAAYLESLKKNPAYDGIDVDREIGKARQWLTLPKARGRRFTRSFVVNWLNKCDPTLTLNGNTNAHQGPANPRTENSANAGRTAGYNGVGRVQDGAGIQKRGT